MNKWIEVPYYGHLHLHYYIQALFTVIESYNLLVLKFVF